MMTVSFMRQEVRKPDNDVINQVLFSQEIQESRCVVGRGRNSTYKYGRGQVYYRRSKSEELPVKAGLCCGRWAGFGGVDNQNLRWTLRDLALLQPHMRQPSPFWRQADEFHSGFDVIDRTKSSSLRIMLLL